MISSTEIYWLHVAGQETKKENERLVIIMHKEQVGLLRLDVNCSISDATEKMQKIFGIDSIRLSLTELFELLPYGKALTLFQLTNFNPYQF